MWCDACHNTGRRLNPARAVLMADGKLRIKPARVGEPLFISCGECLGGRHSASCCEGASLTSSEPQPLQAPAKPSGERL